MPHGGASSSIARNFLTLFIGLAALLRRAHVQPQSRTFTPHAPTRPTRTRENERERAPPDGTFDYFTSYYPNGAATVAPAGSNRQPFFLLGKP